MLPPPEKHKFENACDGFFVNGDKRKVASFVQKDESVLSRQLSPNQEHYNHVIYFFVQCLWAFDCIRRDLGDKVINLVLTEREKWLADEPIFTATDADLAENVGIQFAEFVACRMRLMSLDEQISEAGDIEVAAAKLKANLIREWNESLYGARVSTTSRDLARAGIRAVRQNGNGRLK